MGRLGTMMALGSALFACACGPRPLEVVTAELSRRPPNTRRPPGLVAAPVGRPLLSDPGWSPAVKSSLERVIREQGRPDLPREARPVAAIGLDDTVLIGNLGEALLRAAVETLSLRFDDPFWATVPEELGRDELREAVLALRSRPSGDRTRATGQTAGEEEDPDLLFWRKGAMRVPVALAARDSREASAIWPTRAFVGERPEEIRALTRATLHRELTRPMGVRVLVDGEDDDEPLVVREGIRYRPAVIELIEALERYGFDVWIVTATCQWAAEIAAQRLGISPERVLGVRMTLDADGRLMDEPSRPVTWGAGKVEALSRYAGRPPTIALGAGLEDHAMLGAAAELAVLFDRGEGRDGTAAALAEDEGWLIQPRSPSAAAERRHRAPQRP